MKLSLPSRSSRLVGWLLQHTAPLCEALAGLETRIATSEIGPMVVRQPVFIAGLARSGSTILLEALASCEAFASLRYCDYPPVWFPYWWGLLRARLPLPTAVAQERAHGDGITVTPESPEAFDEVFWMHFFEQRHQADVDQRLTTEHCNPRFDRFYGSHIRKLLAVRGKTRYLCKGNYNLARLPYLHALFPDARFVVPIREPVAHVASLIKQHQRFCGFAATSPSVSAHLARTGHFEFGPQRRAECVGDVMQGQQVQADFAAGKDVLAYARQWAMSYGALAATLDADPTLAKATMLVRFEDLTSQPAATLTALGEHCALDEATQDRFVSRWADRLHEPPYRPSFSDQDLAQIRAKCHTVAQKFGYQ